MYGKDTKGNAMRIHRVIRRYGDCTAVYNISIYVALRTKEIFFLASPFLCVGRVCVVCNGVVEIGRNREKSVRGITTDDRSLPDRAGYNMKTKEKKDGASFQIREQKKEKRRYRESLTSSSDNRLGCIYIYCYVIDAEGKKTTKKKGGISYLSISVFSRFVLFDFHIFVFSCPLFRVVWKIDAPSYVSPTLLCEGSKHSL